jgi:pyruvate/2-oxoglutarate dehydrogenase complex dihydrolipoamide dehydrogenase (E3) component/uncharacterized membrane protein YdjX (TVP38/TMEM64 family)
MKSSPIRIVLLLLIGLAIAAFFWFDLDRYLTLDALKAQREALSGWVEANLIAALAAYFGVYVLATALSLPGAVILTLAGGALFGLVTGTIVVSFASSLGATLAFLASRFLFRDAVRAKFGQRLAPIENGVAKDGAFYLFTLRLVPAFPFFLVNLLMGLTPIRTPTFYGVSQLGMFPGTVVFVYAGTQLAQIDSVSGILSPGLIGAFVLLGILPLLMRGLLGGLAARRVYAGHRKPARFDYNVVVIGAGSAGLVSSYIAAAIKAKVALIEKHKMGGDCLNTGCVPSKALIRSARLLADARDSAKLGIRKVEVQFDFAEVMERVQRVVTEVEPHDSIERYTGLGVECISGTARIVSPWEIEVEGRKLSTRSIIIASGARPLVPDLPGLAEVPYLTSDTVWSLREQPRRLLVLGGGPNGCELALAFSRLGCEVTLVGRPPRLLPREDEDVSVLLREVFKREGIRLALGHTAVRIEREGGGGVLIATGPEGEVRLEFDRLLLALGRTPNVDGFGLRELGIVLNQRGTVAADPLMRTNFPNIGVCGDITGPFQFTHVAAHQAWFAAVNQLLAPFWSFKVDYRVIPWATFTDPQVARVGLSEAEAKAQGIAFEVTRYGIDDLDRAIADGTAEGFVKVLTAPGSDRILGTTIVHAEAGELIAEYVMAMKHGIGMNKILGTIHAYPTLMEANKYAAGVWKRAHAPQAALRWAQRFFAWRRG